MVDILIRELPVKIKWSAFNKEVLNFKFVINPLFILGITIGLIPISYFQINQK